MTSAQQKNLYVVLGMPRSGTSAITRGLKALGIDLGDKLMPAEAQFNPKGVYEDRDIVYSINRAVTAKLSYTWESLHFIDDLCKNNPKLDGLKDKACDLLKQRIAGKEHWGFKDPRTSRILSFWQDVFQRLQLKASYVIAVRFPLASAYSWHRLNEVDVESALLLWLNYTIAAVDGTQGENRVFVNYDLMLQNPAFQLHRIKNNLNMNIESDPAEIDAYANQFLDKKLNHYDYEKDVKAQALISIAPICMKIYDLLIKAARDEIDPNSQEFLTAWQGLKQEYATVYPIYCYVDSLLKRNKDQERSLRTIKKSLPWKLVYPLRVIDDKLRAFRRSRKDART